MTTNNPTGRKSSEEWPSIGDKLMSLAVIADNGCLEYAGYLDYTGYGRIKWDGKRFLVHRVAYEFHYGPIPGGKLVCHTCDNRACITPPHLFLGSYQDNYDDMCRKGRRAFAGYTSKLTDANVKVIRRLLATNRFRHWEIGELFGVSAVTVWRIKHGLSYIHVHDELPWRRWIGPLPKLKPPADQQPFMVRRR